MCSTPGVKKVLLHQHFLHQNLSFIIDVFNTKKIAHDSPYKSNQRQANISILTPQCAVFLCGVMHYEDSLHGVMHSAHCGVFLDIVFLTPQKFGTIDSAVWSPQNDAHHRYCLHGVMQTMDIVPAE